MKKITGTSNLIRPKFAAGMLLQHEDLELLNEYTRNLSRLMFGSLFGCGVVCGLEVGPLNAGGGFEIGCGLAIAPSGSPIWVPKSEPMEFDEKCAKGTDPWWVLLCAKSKFCSPRTAMSGCDDEASHIYTREIEGYEIKLENQVPPCTCPCPPDDPPPPKPFESNCRCVDPKSKCYADHYAAKCSCCRDTDCKDDCVVLARIAWDLSDKVWKVDTTGRRLTRPVLMSSPIAAAQLEEPTPTPKPKGTPKPPPTTGQATAVQNG